MQANKPLSKQGRVLGMGNALVDLIFQLPSDDLLEKWALPKGSMTLIDQQQAGIILNHFGQTQPVLATGGSASNTITSIAALGGECGFIGQIGKNDIYGDFYIEHLLKHGIKPYFRRIDTPTGTAITLMSPDTERTFATYLGAASSMTEANISREIFSEYGYFHVEGYMVQNYALLEQSLRLAVDCRMVVSLDLASYNIVKEHENFIRKILPWVDIVFANEEEAKAFTGEDGLEALNVLAKQVAVAVVKLGSRGSVVMHKGKLYHISADKVVKTDSNGAGDSYAAGFLYGLQCGFGVQECGEIASTVATQVVQVTGPKLTAKQWKELLPRIRKIEARNTRWPE